MLSIRNFLYCLATATFICCCIASSAQHPYYYTIHDDNDLPSNEVYQLQQDDFGYMWIGCNAGLFRYDGFTFTPFKNPQQNSIAISGLTIGHNKILYCQNFSGQLFYTDRDSLVLLADVKERTRAHPAFTTDKENNLWMGLPDCLVKQQKDGKQELLFKNELQINELRTGADGALYAIDFVRGLLKISKLPDGRYVWNKVPGDTTAFFAARTTIAKHTDRLLMVSAKNSGGNFFISELRNGSAKIIKEIPRKDIAEFVYAITLIKDRIWLGTSSGAWCLDLDGNIIKNYFHEEKISDILFDREGSYWFSSLQNGIFVVPNLELTAVNTTNSLLKDNNITALKKLGENDLLIGTYSGDIYNYDLNKGALQVLPKSNSAIYANVTSIIPYDAGHIIAARGSVSVIDLPAQKEKAYISLYIRDMVRQGDSIIYVSSEKIGVISAVSSMISSNKYNSHTIKNISGKKICYDEKGGLVWVALNNGLTTFEQNEFIPFKINNAPVFCNVIYADNNGLWAGTVSDGVYNIRDRKAALHIDRSNGLAGSNVRCITSLHDTLYIATDACINIRYPGGRFEYIDYTDGINAKEITAIEFARDHLFIGTIRGLFGLPVHTTFTNTVPPHIRITSVSADGTERSTKERITLPWNTKDMLIHCSAVSLHSRGRLYYVYRILGFQNEWNRLDGDLNYVRLNHLPPGDYIFEVKAANEDGVLSPAEKLHIVISTPFWQQWWFYLVALLSVALLVTLLFLWRIKKIKRDADVRNQLITSQLTALKAQMNPHFMYNTLNSIQDLILQNDIKSTNYYLSRYSTLMRKILASSEHNQIELNEEIEILTLYMELEQLRFGDDFQYTISIPDHIDKHSILIPSMIIQPFVENAIKHGLLHKKGVKELSIAFNVAGDCLTCTIKDNGIGRKKAAEIKQRSPLEHKSFATKATERRLELINIDRNQKIELAIVDLESNDQAGGTEVKLIIPLS